MDALLHGLPERDAPLARQPPNRIHGLAANAPRRQVDDALECDIRVGLVQEAHVGEGVLDLRPLEEAQATVNPVRDVRPQKRFLQGAALRVRAIQHGDLVGAAAAIDEALGAFRDEARLFHLVVALVKEQRVAGAGGGPQGFAQALGVLFDEAVCGVEDGARGAVVLLQPNHLGVCEVFREALDVLHLGAAPAIDGLIVIAHGHDVALGAGQHPQGSILNDVRVLELIDQDVPKAPLIVFKQRRLFEPELVAAQEQLGEIHHAALLAKRLVGGVDALVGFLEVISARHLAGASAGFLGGIDEADGLPRRPLLLVQFQRAQHTLHQTHLIVRVDDLEVLRQSGFLPMHPQQPVRDAVERAHPHRRCGHQRLRPPAHLGRRLVGEGDGQDAVGRDVLGGHQPGDAMHQHPRLAAAGAGEHQQVAGRGRHGFALPVVQAFEDWRQVHRVSACVCPAASSRGCCVAWRGPPPIRCLPPWS